MPKHLLFSLPLLLTLSLNTSSSGQSTALFKPDSMVLVDLWKQTGGPNWGTKWFGEVEVNGVKIPVPAYAWPGVIVENGRYLVHRR